MYFFVHCNIKINTAQYFITFYNIALLRGLEGRRPLWMEAHASAGGICTACQDHVIINIIICIIVIGVVSIFDPNDIICITTIILLLIMVIFKDSA